jgi:hypothetical protein
MAIGERLISRLGQGGAAAAARAEIHLRLAHAAVDGTRWAAATVHLDAAKGLLAADPRPALSARAAVLEAEVAFAAHDVDGARRQAEQVLASEHASPDVRCHAFQTLTWRSGACGPCTSWAPSRCSTTRAQNAWPRPG